MRRVVRVKLLPTLVQELALAETLRVCNAAATYVSQVAFGGRDSQGRTGTKFILQDVLYQDVKARFGLGAQPAIRVIGKTVDAYTTLRANLLEGNLGLPGSPGGPRPSRNRLCSAQARPNPSIRTACPGSMTPGRCRSGPRTAG